MIIQKGSQKLCDLSLSYLIYRWQKLCDLSLSLIGWEEYMLILADIFLDQREMYLANFFLLLSLFAMSWIPEAPPAVTTPPFLNTGGSLASCSMVVLGLGCSSNFISTSFFLIFSVIGVISSAKTPASAAAPQVCCDRRAKASQSSLKSLNQNLVAI